MADPLIKVQNSWSGRLSDCSLLFTGYIVGRVDCLTVAYFLLAEMTPDSNRNVTNTAVMESDWVG